MRIIRLSALAALALAACLPYLYTPADTLEKTTRVAGATREYLLYVPKSYDGSKPVPLVVTFHGFSQWPAHEAWLSRWNRVAEEQGFIVAYPSGTWFPKRWAMHGPHGVTLDPAPDVAFFRRMVGDIAREYRVDAARVYVNGLSNGGGMTYLLACELAGHIAAVGIVSGGLLEPPGGCRPSRPVPVIVFHGTGDDIVPYEGGKLFVAPEGFGPVEGWVADWSRRNGCAPEPVSAPVSAHVALRRYAGCGQGSDVELYVIDGGGHAWPGGEALPTFIAGETTQEIDATRLMWAFFEQHARTPASNTGH